MELRVRVIIYRVLKKVIYLLRSLKSIKYSKYLFGKR